MTQRDFERKQRFGIRKFTVGAASVVIGAVVFGASPVLAQEAPTTSGETAGQALPELPKEVETGNLANLDKELADKLATATDKGTEVNREELQANPGSEKPTETETPAETPAAETGNAEETENDNYSIDIEIKKLESANSGSFKIDSIYGKDKNNLYFLNKKIKGVNPKTFEIVGSNKLIIKDDKGVYYLGREEVKKIQNADLNTFEEVSKEYYRDKNNIFYYDNYDGDVKKVKGADAKTFEVIDSGYAIGRDKNAVYDRGKQIKGLDPVTFEDLSGNFYKDKNGVYYEGMLMKGIDPKSFEPFVNYTHVKDKNGIHHFYQKSNNVVVEKVEISPEIDLKTLQPIENYSEYSKDKNNVYYNFKKIEDNDINDVDEYFTDINSEYIKNRTCLRIRKTNNKQMEITFKGKSRKFF